MAYAVNSRAARDGEIANPFLDHAYAETEALLCEARNFSRDYPLPFYSDGSDAGLRIVAEQLRVTSRLGQVMAWLMVRRAVQAGEISSQEGLNEHRRLGAEATCLNLRNAENQDIPSQLHGLMGRSLSLYRRIARLEGQLLSRQFQIDSEGAADAGPDALYR